MNTKLTEAIETLIDAIDQFDYNVGARELTNQQLRLLAELTEAAEVVHRLLWEQKEKEKEPLPPPNTDWPHIVRLWDRFEAVGPLTAGSRTFVRTFQLDKALRWAGEEVRALRAAQRVRPRQFMDCGDGCRWKGEHTLNGKCVLAP